MYALNYSPQTGKASSIKRVSDGACIPLAPDNTDFQKFLIWNAEQKVPLDLKSTIEVEVITPPPTAEERIDRLLVILKAKVVLTDKEAGDIISITR